MVSGPTTEEVITADGSSRRGFLQHSAAAGVALPLQARLARTATSDAKVLGANHRIHVALIGCGGMGSMDLGDFLRVKNVACLGLCDVDESHRGNFGYPDSAMEAPDTQQVLWELPEFSLNGNPGPDARQFLRLAKGQKRLLGYRQGPKCTR